MEAKKFLITIPTKWSSWEDAGDEIDQMEESVDLLSAMFDKIVVITEKMPTYVGASNDPISNVDHIMSLIEKHKPDVVIVDLEDHEKTHLFHSITYSYHSGTRVWEYWYEGTNSVLGFAHITGYRVHWIRILPNENPEQHLYSIATGG